MNQELKCVNPEHDAPCTLICLDQDCPKKGIICFQCMEEKHYGHKIISFNSFLKKMEEFCNEFDEEKFNEKPQEFIIIKGTMEMIELSIENFHASLKSFYKNINDFLEGKRNYLEKLKPFIRKETIITMLSNIKKLEEPECANKELINFLNLIDFSNNNPLMSGKGISENEQRNIIDLNKKLEDYHLFMLSKLKLFENEINDLSDLEKCLAKKQEEKINIIKEKSILRRKRRKVFNSNQEENNNVKKTVKIQNQRFHYDPIKDKEYLQFEEVFCHFCHESSKNSELFNKLGFIFGPYNIIEKSYYAHEMCALWTTDIHLDEKDSIFNSFSKFIVEKKNTNCEVCRMSGAGLSCCKNNCGNTYHFKCIVDDKEVVFHKEKFQITCPRHRPKKRIRRKENKANCYILLDENNKQRTNIQENSNFSKEIMEMNSKNIGLNQKLKVGEKEEEGHISKEDKLFLLTKFQENEKLMIENIPVPLPISFEDIDENNEEQLDEFVKKKIKYEN